MGFRENQSSFFYQRVIKRVYKGGLDVIGMKIMKYNVTLIKRYLMILCDIIFPLYIHI